MAKLVTGQPAPDFTLPDLDGRSVSLSALRGQLVLVNFWSVECPWAARADQALVAWQDRVVLLAVASNANEAPDDLRRVSAERGIRTVLLDSDHSLADRFGAETTPHCFLIDRAGLLRYQGAFDDVTFRHRQQTRLYVIEAIQALLSDQPVPVTESPPYGCTIVRFAE